MKKLIFLLLIVGCKEKKISQEQRASNSTEALIRSDFYHIDTISIKKDTMFIKKDTLSKNKKPVWYTAGDGTVDTLAIKTLWFYEQISHPKKPKVKKHKLKWSEHGIPNYGPAPKQSGKFWDIYHWRDLPDDSSGHTYNLSVYWDSLGRFHEDTLTRKQLDSLRLKLKQKTHSRIWLDSINAHKDYIK